MTTTRAIGLSAAALGLALLAPSTSSAQLTVFMDGLNSPRGLAFDGNVLYVAEAGTGGTVPGGVSGSGNPFFYGTTGRISTRDITGGPQTVFLEGLPSVAAADGTDAQGPNDVQPYPDGSVYALIGLGANPAVRQSEPLSQQALGSWLASLIRRNPDASVERVFDFGAFEQTQNPDGAVIDTNPFRMAPFLGPTLVVSDAGGNAIISVDPTSGTVGTWETFPARPNPLPIGPSEFQAVPTGVAFDADNFAVYVAELTGFPFVAGEARVYRLQGGQNVHATGLTNLIDLAIADDGTLYALSFDINGILNPGDTGGLYRINTDGTFDLILSDGLTNPTGLTIGPDGAFYISNNGNTPGAGQVLRFVPEPTALTLLAPAALLLTRRPRAPKPEEAQR